MKFRRAHRLHCALPDAAPWVGVMFVLLFFALQRAPGLTVELPTTDTPSAVALTGPVVAVALTGDGRLYFRNQRVSAEDLQKALRAMTASGELTVVLQADKAVSYERLIHVAQQVRDGGVKKVLLATRPALFQPSQP